MARKETRQEHTPPQDLAPSSILFTHDDASPIVFYVPSGTLRQVLGPIVNSGGGLVTSSPSFEDTMSDSENPTPLYTIVDGSTAPTSAPHPLRVDYIYDCVKAGKLLPPAKYSVPEAQGTQDSVDLRLLAILETMDSGNDSNDGDGNGNDDADNEDSLTISVTNSTAALPWANLLRASPEGVQTRSEAVCSNVDVASSVGSEVVSVCSEEEDIGVRAKPRKRRSQEMEFGVTEARPSLRHNHDSESSEDMSTKQLIASDTLEAMQDKLIRMSIERGSALTSYKEKCELLVDSTDFSAEECSNALYAVSGELREALLHLYQLQQDQCLVETSSTSDVHSWTQGEDKLLLSTLQQLSQEVGGLPPALVANRMAFLAQHYSH